MQRCPGKDLSQGYVASIQDISKAAKSGFSIGGYFNTPNSISRGVCVYNELVESLKNKKLIESMPDA